jgi:hypothetical protein
MTRQGLPQPAPETATTLLRLGPSKKVAVSDNTVGGTPR